MAESKTTPDLLFARHLAAQKVQVDKPRYSADAGVLYEWTGTHWQAIDQQKTLEKIAWDWLASNSPEDATSRRAASCAQAAILHARQLPPHRLAHGVEAIIPTLSGVLEIVRVGTGDVTEHIDYVIHSRHAEQEDGLTYVVGCEHHPEAHAPEFERFVSEILPDEKVREYVREYIGATLLPDTRFQTAQFWLGGGSNGKSTLAEIVSALHAEVAAIELDQLSGFQLLPLLGASLAYVDETPCRIDEQKLKALISGGLVQIDRKYLPPVSINVRAKWLICGNRLPSVSDQSLGFWRRLPVIPFNIQIPPEKRDLLLKPRIIDNELPGVLSWAVGGLINLLQRGRIAPMPHAVATAVAGGKSETNSVLAWVENEDVEKDNESSASKESVYSAYRGWCLANNMQALGSPRFWIRLTDVIGDLNVTFKRVGGKRVRCVPIRVPEA